MAQNLFSAAVMIGALRGKYPSNIDTNSLLSPKTNQTEVSLVEDI